MLDLLIKNGVVVDGVGSPRARGDVGIVGDRIVEVGKVSTPTRRVIDADGLLVTPGFVDIHTHYDGQASWDGVLAPSSINGVTSIGMGNCGVGFAPARPDRHDWLIGLLEGVEDIPGTALAEGLTWDWESFPDYLDALDRRAFAVDLGAHLPHAALRAYVMGERGADHAAAPTDDEVARMRNLTREALEAGAMGFSTSRTYVHRTRDGSNIGTLSASALELLGIASALGDTGRGVLQVISDAYLSEDDAYVEDELALLRSLAETTGRPLSFTVQQVDNAPDRWRRLLGWADDMTAQGLTVRSQVAPRPIGVILSFASTINPFFTTPTYRGLSDLPVAERLARLADADVKTRILAEHSQRRLNGMLAPLVQGFGRMFRMSDPVDYEPPASASLAAEAERLGREPAEYAYDVFLEEGGRRLIYGPMINYAQGDLSAVYEMMVHENSLFGLSDGGAHCGTICDASFPTTAVALWSRGDRAGRTIPLEQLVCGYTSRNARHVGWMDRGVVAPGYLADLNVIDLDGLELGPPEIVRDLPAGGARLLQRPRGYRWTVKSGVPTFERGEWTGELPGRLVRGATTQA
jgi:N-acyl-D-amino-acid deacylase